MSSKVGVIAKGQDPQTTRPHRHVKRVVAQLLVRRLMYEWVRHDCIRELDVQSAIAHKQRPKKYIPAQLPWAELPGIVFKHESSQLVRTRARWANRHELWPSLERMADELHN